MPNFSEVAAGIRARRPILLPLPGATVDEETGEWSGPTHPLDIRALNEGEHDEVLAAALAYCRSKGLERPEEGDAIYERAKMLHTIARACIDRDSPPENPQPFFDGGVEQIQKSEVMTPEVIGYLYEQQRLMQDDVAPLKKDMSPAEFFAAAVETAKGNISFFVNSQPGMQWNFVRTLASQFIASLESNSHSSTSSELQTPTTDSATT